MRMNKCLKGIVLKTKLGRLKRRRRQLESYVLINYPHLIAKKENIDSLSNIGNFSELDRKIARYNSIVKKNVSDKKCKLTLLS